MKKKISRINKISGEIKEPVGISMHHRLVSFLFIVIFTIIFFLISYCFPFIDMEIKRDTLYYTLSSIIQGFIGLLAFLGMLGVFRFDLVKRNISRGMENVAPLILQARFLEPGSIPTEDNIISECENIKNGAYNINLHKKQLILMMYEKICKDRNDEKEIREEIIKFLTFPTFTVISALVLLFLIDVFGFLVPTLSVFVVLLSIYSLVSIVFYGRVLIKCG